jgi:hypothetical protein
MRLFVIINAIDSMTSPINTEPLNTACQSQHTYVFNVKKRNNVKRMEWDKAWRNKLNVEKDGIKLN